jgi:uncharacterized surface protein with fasciclin (FAS1) repeats
VRHFTSSARVATGLLLVGLLVLTVQVVARQQHVGEVRDIAGAQATRAVPLPGRAAATAGMSAAAQPTVAQIPTATLAASAAVGPIAAQPATPTPPRLPTPTAELSTATPEDAVRAFYSLLGRRDFQAVVSLFSARMSETMPSDPGLLRDRTPPGQLMIRQLTLLSIDGSGNNATVGVDVLEQLSPTVARRYVGTWKRCAVRLAGSSTSPTSTSNSSLHQEGFVQQRDMLRVSGLGTVATLVLVLCSSLPAAAQTTTNNDLIDALSACGQCAKFVSLVQTAGLTDTLRGAGPYTVWAPTDAAVSGLPAATMQRLLQDPNALRDVVRYHLAQGTVTAAQIVQVPTVKTVQGEFVRISAAGGTVRINQAPVVQADLSASNGIIHVIGGVLIPPSQIQAIPQTGSWHDTSWPTVMPLVGLAFVALGLVFRRQSAKRVL